MCAFHSLICWARFCFLCIFFLCSFEIPVCLSYFSWEAWQSQQISLKIKLSENENVKIHARIFEYENSPTTFYFCSVLGGFNTFHSYFILIITNYFVFGVCVCLCVDHTVRVICAKSISKMHTDEVFINLQNSHECDFTMSNRHFECFCAIYTIVVRYCIRRT